MFDAFAQQILVPLALELFPASARREDLEENYPFVVRYKEGEDLDLAIHGDASCVTLNLCLGKDGFSGGELAFEEFKTGFGYANTPPEERWRFRWDVGTAVLHRGQHRHEALPIQSGERINLVIWLFGHGGYVRIAEYPKDEQHTPEEIWQDVSIPHSRETKPEL